LPFLSVRDVVGDHLLHRRRRNASRERRPRRLPPPRRGSAAMRLLVAGGGTGGHLFPGLALVEEVKTRHPRKRRAVSSGPRAASRRARCPRPATRCGSSTWVRSAHGSDRPHPGAAPRPARVLAVGADPAPVRSRRGDRGGGYSSGPVLLAAWLMRKPTAIQEQNALPGFTNRTLGRFVDAIFIAFPQAEAKFPGARRTCSAIRSVAPSWTTTCTPSRPAIGSASSSPAVAGCARPQPPARRSPEVLGSPDRPPAPGPAPDGRQGPAGDGGPLREARVDRPASAGGGVHDDMPRAYAGADLLCAAPAPPPLPS